MSTIVKVLFLDLLRKIKVEREHYKILHEPLQQDKIFTMLPITPSLMFTFWKNHEAFNQKYLIQTINITLQVIRDIMMKMFSYIF